MPKRRVGLPAEIRAELPKRANMGIGLDPDYPTPMGDKGKHPAAVACRYRPSPQMKEFVQQVAAYVQANNATHVRVQVDYRERDYPGDLLLAWSDGPSPADVAAKFAVSTAEDGTPRLPAWLALGSDNDFDLRWRPAF